MGTIVEQVAAAKKRVGRPVNKAPKERAVLGADLIAKLDEIAAAAEAKLGFKPSLPQTITMLVAEHEGKDSVMMVGVKR